MAEIIKVSHETPSELLARTTHLRDTVRALGADGYNMLLPETRALAYVIRPDEQILGIVYGRYKQGFDGQQVGRGALIATDGRILLLDKKPMFVRVDEVVYPAVRGVTYGHVGIMGTVTVHSRTGDVTVRTFNQKCAKNFFNAVDSKIMIVSGGTL